MKRFGSLALLLALFLVLAMVLPSCSGCESAKDDDGDTSDDDDTDDDNDTDDDTHTDDDDDDAEDWYIYVVDTDEYSENPSIAVDSSNKVHISYYDYYEDFGLMYATNALRKVYSWQVFMVDSGKVGRYSSIGVDPNNKVHISYYDKDNQDIKYATNKTGSWQIFTVADVGTVGPNIAGLNSLALDSSGKVYIVYHYCGQNEPGGCSDNDLRLVTNDSGTWQVITLDTPAMRPSIAIHQDKIHISYDGSSGLRYMTNASGEWEIFEIDDRGYASTIAVDSAGKVHIVYQDRDVVKYATNASGSWQVSTLPIESASSMVMDKNDKMHISYRADDMLKYATNKSGEWKTYTIDSLGLSSSIAVDSDGYVHIAYRGGEEDALKYATNRPPE